MLMAARAITHAKAAAPDVLSHEIEKRRSITHRTGMPASCRTLPASIWSGPTPGFST